MRRRLAIHVRRVRAFADRWHAAITVLGCLLVAGALAVVLAGRGGEFTAALGAAPIVIIAVAVLLHVVWLVARSEAWHVCVEAAGGTAGRARLYRAASVGYLGNLFNGQFGAAVRIAALRRSAPEESPHVPALIAAEFPVLVVEAALAAIMSFTLVGPLGLPWWVPILCLAFMVAVVAALRAVSRERRHGFWSGLAVMRGLQGRSMIIGLVVFAICAQIARNWLLLGASGVDASVLDSVALLIGLAVIGLLPVGPSLGAGAAVLILGADGAPAAAAAGVLLTATGAVGAFCFAGWALADRFWRGAGAPARPASAEV